MKWTRAFRNTEPERRHSPAKSKECVRRNSRSQRGLRAAVRLGPSADSTGAEASNSYLHGFAHGPGATARVACWRCAYDPQCRRTGYRRRRALFDFVDPFAGTRSIAIIQHTECGLISITDDE